MSFVAGVGCVFMFRITSVSFSGLWLLQVWDTMNTELFDNRDSAVPSGMCASACFTTWQLSSLA